MSNAFLEFLMDEHAKEYTGNGDDITIAFEEWLRDMEIDTWLLYGDRYGKEALKQYKKDLQIYNTVMDSAKVITK